MKISEVLNANKEIRILNIVKFNKWDNIEISEKYIKMLNYDMSYTNYNIDMDMDRIEINNYYKTYIKSLADSNTFNKFLKVLKDMEINNISNRTLLKLHGLDDYFNSWDEVKIFILNNILLEIKEINV